MANDTWASGHILCFEQSGTPEILNRINQLPEAPYQSDFSIWKGIFHSPEAPSRAGRIITFGLSHKYFGDPDEIGTFLDFWENLIDGIRAQELFIAVEQSFITSDQPFGKFYFQWLWKTHPKSNQGRWVFCGTMPIDQLWKSRFETDIHTE